jgi:hypothetical protein
VSVALCTHNGARYVDEQIRSILTQSRPVDEIVVGDDASTDATVSIIEAAVAELGAPGLVVTVLRNPVALGVTANFEATLRACGGDILLLSDQDDVWHADRVERTLAAFDGRPEVTLVHTDARLVDGDGQPTGLSLFEGLALSDADIAREHDGDGFAVLLTRNIVTGASVGLRRSLLERALPLPPEWLHDEWLAAIAAVTGGLDVVEESLLDYRQHASNVVGVTPLTLAQKWGKLVEPRADRNVLLARRSEVLVERLAHMPGVGADLLHAARGKLLHESRRAALPANRVLRLPVIAAEWAGGRYATYGRGLPDIARDLVQPY